MKKACSSCGYLAKGEMCEKCMKKSASAGKTKPIKINKAEPKSGAPKAPSPGQAVGKPAGMAAPKQPTPKMNMPKMAKSIEPGMSYNQLKKADADLNSKFDQVTEMADKARAALSKIKPESK